MREEEFAREAIDGTRLFGQLWQGKAEPRGVICLVHGQGEHSGRYAGMAGTLTAAGYAVLAYDLRGHGRSGGRRGHAPCYRFLMDDLAQQLGEARRRFPDLPCFLFGHSLGGSMVINYALRFRPAVAGVVASAPSLRLGKPPSPVKWVLGNALARVWPTFVFRTGITPEANSHNAAAVAAARRDPLGHDRVTARLGVDLILSGAWALDHAADFPVPLLIMHGSADAVTSPLASRDFIRRAPGDRTFKRWEGLYHELRSEPQRDEVLAYLIAWLDDHRGAAA